MFRTIIIFLIISFHINLTAQTKELDSLRKAVYSYTKSDTTKFRFWKEYHDGYYKGLVNYDSMQFIHSNMDELAIQLNDSLSKSVVLMIKSNFYNKKRNHSKSIELLKRAEMLLPKKQINPNKNYKFYIYTELGIQYFFTRNKENDMDSCIYYYNKSLEFAIADKEKIGAYNRLSQVFIENREIEKSRKLNNDILTVAKKTKDLAFYSSYYTAQANLFEFIGSKDSSIFYRKKDLSLSLSKDKDKKGYYTSLASDYSSLASVYGKFQEVDSAIFYFEKSMSFSREYSILDSYRSSLAPLIYHYRIRDRLEDGLNLINSAIDFGHEIGDSSLIATSMFSMVFIYDGLKNYNKAIEINNELLKNYLSVLSLAKEGEIYGNQSYLYFENMDYLNAVKYGLKAYRFNPKNPVGLFNLADAYLAAYNDSTISKKTILSESIENEINTKLTEDQSKERVLELSRDYYEMSLELLISKGNNKFLLQPHFGLGRYYDIVGDDKKVIYHYDQAWKYSKRDGVALNDQLRIASRLYELNKKKNKASEALKWLEITDSLEKVELSKNDLALLGKKQAEFEYSQKIYADSLEQKQKDLAIKYEQEKQALKLKAEEEKKYYLYGGLFLLVLFLFVLYRRFKVAVKQKHLIELQKESIEEKRIALRKTHEGVQDSINYSKRIQKAVFPSLETVKSLFPTSFLFFKPKDVVSGDFYWVYKTKGKKVIVTADCTGHGVPGAFMTIIGINILKEIVQEGIVEAGEILKEINKRLIERLSQQGKSSVKDGMDLALCIIDDNIIEFVGAHLPLYHVRNGELNEYKGSNIFLGSKLEMIEPKVNYIPYNSGDLIYMSTDGLPDQKGGEKGKKFYSKRLKEFLLSNSKLSMVEQETKLVNLRKDWLNGKYEQLDDITIVGIKL